MTSIVAERARQLRTYYTGPSYAVKRLRWTNRDVTPFTEFEMFVNVVKRCLSTQSKQWLSGKQSYQVVQIRYPKVVISLFALFWNFVRFQSILFKAVIGSKGTFIWTFGSPGIFTIFTWYLYSPNIPIIPVTHMPRMAHLSMRKRPPDITALWLEHTVRAQLMPLKGEKKNYSHVN